MITDFLNLNQKCKSYVKSWFANQIEISECQVIENQSHPEKKDLNHNHVYTVRPSRAFDMSNKYYLLTYLLIPYKNLVQ